MTSNLPDVQKKASGTVSVYAQRLIDFASRKLEAAVEEEDGYFVAPEALATEIDSERIVSRPCYDHMLPIVKAQLEKEKESRICITGTPGIGKTVFGFVLFRHLVREGCSTVYWDSAQATLLSKEPSQIELYGLKNECKIEEDGSWRWGAWKHDEDNLDELLYSDTVCVVHDPADGYVRGGTNPHSRKLVTVLSYGHELISIWNTKKRGLPHRTLTMPVFAYDEIFSNKNNLFHGKNMTDDQTNQLYQIFGGCIRFFTGDPIGPWRELRGKIADVVNGGGNIAVRTKSHRGTIVHVVTDFDKTNPSNTFENRGFILGSTAIVDAFNEALLGKGRDWLVSFMASIKGSQGDEAVYGMLFEKYAHSMLQEKGKVFNIRVVRFDGKNKNGYATIEIPAIESVKNFSGNEANCITEQLKDSLKVGTYIAPSSSNFPTYDAALVVPGGVVGLADDTNIALLLQMTVSGATGIRRRPNHSVKQYMRREMHSALQASVDGFSDKKSLSVTTFCVPTESFHPFLFQYEENQNTDAQSQNQAEFQFVIEIPEFNRLDVSEKPLNEIHGQDGEHHRYMLRKRKAREVMVQDMYQMEDDDNMDESLNSIN